VWGRNFVPGWRSDIVRRLPLSASRSINNAGVAS
jgi:hypothetical protein